MRGRTRLLVATCALFVAVSDASAASAATSWAIGAAVGSHGEARAKLAPTAPTGVTATCTAFFGTTVKVAWNAVPLATGYTVFESTTSAASGYAPVATGVVATNWTTPALASGNYWFEVAASIGTNWVSANSAASAKRTITAFFCT
jgi:hypothetical protein